MTPAPHTSEAPSESKAKKIIGDGSVFRPHLTKSKAVTTSVEQEEAIDNVLKITSSDSQMARKAREAVHFILSLADAPPPTIESIEPNTGEIDTSPSVVITGTGFDNGSKVLLAGVEQNTIFVSDTELQAVLVLGSIADALAVAVKNSNNVISDEVSFVVTAPAKAVVKQEVKQSDLATTDPNKGKK